MNVEAENFTSFVDDRLRDDSVISTRICINPVLFFIYT